MIAKNRKVMLSVSSI